MGDADDFDLGVRAAFGRLCRLVGSQRARVLIVDVCSRAGSESRASVTPDALIGEACRAAVRDDATYGGLATEDRALLDLADVRGRSAEEIAEILDLRRFTDARLDQAREAFSAGYPFSTVDEAFRAEESWCDDELIAACRRAFDEHLAASAETAAPAARGATKRRTPGRRMQIASVVALVAVLVVVVVVIVAARSRRDPAPSGRDVSPTTTAEARQNAPGFVLQVPAGFVVAEAGNIDESAAAVGWLQLWADPGATRTSRHWFQIATTCGTSDVVGLTEGAERVEVAGQPTLLLHHADGVLEIRTVVPSGPGNLDPSTSVDLTGFGFSADSFTSLASMVVSAIGSATGDSTTPTCATRTASPFDGPSSGATPTSLRPLVDRATSPDSAPVALVEYRATDGDTGQVLTVVTRDVDPDSTAIDPFTYGAASGDAPVIDAATGPVRLWDVPDDHPGSTHDAVVWNEQDRRITIDAVGVPPSTLAMVAAGAHLAGEDEWRQLTDGATQPAATDTGDTVVGTLASNTKVESLLYVDVTRYTTSYGTAWGLVERAPGEIGIYSNTGPGFLTDRLDVDADHPIHVFASQTLTILVAALPPGSPPSTLAVTVGTVQQPPIALVGARTGDQYAIFVFNELGPWTASVLAAGQPSGQPTGPSTSGG